MRSVNCAIPLTETQMQVLISAGGELWGDVEAKVTMPLSPTPRVVIEIAGGQPILYGRDGRLTLRLPFGPEFEAYVAQAQIGDVSWSRLIPTRQPVTVVQTGDVQSVEFNVINFPCLEKSTRPAVLQAGPWYVELEPHAEIREIKNALDAESGYAFTHQGSLRRSDSKSFSVEDADNLLNTLHLFLSFARGGSCGITSVVGNDGNGKKAWEKWGTYSTHSWCILSSWLDHRHNNHDELSMAWPGFWRVVGETKGAQDDAVRVALYWYLRSNETDSPYTGIVLTQAALERLAVQLGKHRVRDALKCAEVPTAIPDYCNSLVEVGKPTGPESLIALRNALVHAKSRKNVGLDAYLEAWELGQWYVELLFLKLFGYDGQYANRLTYSYKGILSPEVVPWGRDRGSK